MCDLMNVIRRDVLHRDMLIIRKIISHDWFRFNKKNDKDKTEDLKQIVGLR